VELTSPAFWAALGSIILANILLSGDNAVVIALAARGLPPRLQKPAILLGSIAAIVMRIILTVIAVQLLGLPWLKLVGGALLLWIGASLLVEDDGGAGHDAPVPGVANAVRTILVADLVMSLDNVLAVAAAAQGDEVLLALGLAISIPLIIFGSTLLLKVMERFPIIVVAGAALLGWLAGEMMLTDPVVEQWFGQVPGIAVTAGGVAGAILVVIAGKWMQRRKAATRAPRT
jgi:YjbE family integral membrane protein